MELFHLSTEVTLEDNTTESARPSLDLLNELELCMVGGGMGDVLQSSCARQERVCFLTRRDRNGSGQRED